MYSSLKLLSDRQRALSTSTATLSATLHKRTTGRRPLQHGEVFLVASQHIRHLRYLVRLRVNARARMLAG